MEKHKILPTKEPNFLLLIEKTSVMENGDCKLNVIRAENFRMVDIEINAWSSLFANLKPNLVFRLISRD